MTGALIGGVVGLISGGYDGMVDGIVNGFADGFMMGAISGAIEGAISWATAPQCFAEGTLVLTQNGNTSIEQITAGTMVWAYNEETNESDWKPVVQVFRNATLVFNHVHIDDEEIVCTPEHPFYILNATDEKPIVRFEGRNDKDFDGQWVQAKYLNAGDKVLLSNGKTAIIEKNWIEHLDEPATTYNFEVADLHNYYVGEEGILVHNDCPLSYLDEALSQNGYTRSDIPELTKNGTWSHEWSKNGADYELWIHIANKEHHPNAIYTFRVKSRPIGVKGWKYLGGNGAWYPATYVQGNSDQFRNLIMRITHIHYNP